MIDRPRAGWTGKLALALAAVLVMLLAIELVAFPLLLPYLPLNAQQYLPEEIATLAQSSKSGTVPHRYVAITGDSYAQGFGDWLHSLGRYSNGPYHSAHVLHELSGRDVITLGRGGAGSITGLVFKPFDHLRRTETTGRLQMPPPELLIVYFYEGSDLLDTLYELAVLSKEAQAAGDVQASSEPVEGPPTNKLFAPALANPELRDEQSMQAFIERAYERRRSDQEQSSVFDAFYFTRFLLAMLRGRGSDLFPAGTAPGATTRWQIKKKGPRILVAGSEYDVPEALQTPAMEIGEAETELALDAYAASLSVLRRRLGATPACVVYIPSPLSVYTLVERVNAEPDAAAEGSPPPQNVRQSEVRARSAYLRARIGKLTRAQGVRFEDATPDIEEEAQGRILHGPRDWLHFNEQGYRLLASVALRCLDDSDR